MSRMLDEDERDLELEEDIATVLQKRLTEGTNLGRMQREENVVTWTMKDGRRVYFIVEAEQEP